MTTASDEVLRYINGRQIIASVSGGKDSAAMCLHLQEMGIPYRAVFLDTGWEHPATMDYLRGELTQKIGPIREARGQLNPAAQKRVDDLLASGRLPARVEAALEAGSLFVALILSRGMFPSRLRRFCTQELKVFAMQQVINEIVDAGQDVVNAVGIRRAESQARSAMTEWEWSKGFDCEVWRPLVAWSEADVIAIHTRNGLRPNPLYLQGAARVGCWPCIHVNKRELRFVADSDPERIALLDDLEKVVGDLAAERYAAKGETFESLGYLRPAFYQAPIGRTGDTWPIRKMVAWSRTSRGGKQLEIMADPGEAGCVRWGLCDTGTDADPA